MVVQGDLVPMQCNGRMVSLSHFLYTDDILVFERATRRNLGALLEVFNAYGDISG